MQQDETDKQITQALADLRVILTDRLDYGDLPTICFDLGQDFNNIPGDTNMVARTRELIIYLKRRNQLDKLIDWIRRRRPDIEIPPSIAAAIRITSFQTSASYSNGHTDSQQLLDRAFADSRFQEILNALPESRHSSFKEYVSDLVLFSSLLISRGQNLPA